jgi:hypothetical protein
MILGDEFEDWRYFISAKRSVREGKEGAADSKP